MSTATMFDSRGRIMSLLETDKVEVDCERMVGFTQIKGTCWLNSIMNALFMSKWGGKLMQSLYVDWVIGFRDPKNVKKQNIYKKQLTFAYDASLEYDTKKREYKPERMLGKLHRYSPDTFPNIGTQKGLMSNKYLKNLLVFMGVPLERIAWFNISNGENMDGIMPAIEKKLSCPLMIIVNLDKKFREVGRSDTPKIAGYVLDSMIITEWFFDGKKWPGHAIAGVTCGKKRKLIDANPGLDRIREFNWSSNENKITTTSTRGFVWTTKSNRILIYYNANIINSMHAASKRIAKDWLSDPSPLKFETYKAMMRGDEK